MHQRVSAILPRINYSPPGPCYAKHSRAREPCYLTPHPKPLLSLTPFLQLRPSSLLNLLPLFSSQPPHRHSSLLNPTLPIFSLLFSIPHLFPPHTSHVILILHNHFSSIPNPLLKKKNWVRAFGHTHYMTCTVYVNN